MKMVFLILLLCLIPVLLMAYDLNEVARKERARRQELAISRRDVQIRTFKDSELEVYHRLRGDSQKSPPESRWKRSNRRPLAPSRDLVKERAHWQNEKTKHERERARLNASIRRLEWRLAERKAKKAAGGASPEGPHRGGTRGFASVTPRTANAVHRLVSREGPQDGRASRLAEIVIGCLRHHAGAGACTGQGESVPV